MNVLLANGFSIACCKDIFTYKKLFDSADFSEGINKVFKEFDTFDFEKIIKKLDDTSKIVNIYDKETLKRIITNPKYKGYYRGHTTEVINYRIKKRMIIPEEKQFIYKDQKETGTE